MGKVCEICGDEIATRDGENRCSTCDESGVASKAKRAAARAQRKAREDAMRSCGLVKVRGAMGGVYWE